MRLYYVKTMFQFLSALIDKLVSAPDKKAVFMINPFIKQHLISIDDFCSNFNCDYIEYDTNLITSPDTIDKNKWLDDIVTYYDNLFKKAGYLLSDFDYIHIFASLRFSLYLCKKNITFLLHEDGNGSASKTGFVQWRENTDNVNKKEVAEFYGLIDGSCKLAKKLFCRFKSQTKSMPSKAEDFDLDILLKKIQQKYIDKIISLFTDQDLKYAGSPCLILTQYYFKDKKIENSENNRARLYQNIANYFTPKCEILIKPHPADKVNYRNYFKANIINKDMPSELLLCCESLHFSKCVTVSSTSIELMKNKAEELITLGEDIGWIVNYCDILQGAISLYKTKFMSLKFMHFGIFNDHINKILYLNNLKPSSWFSDINTPKFLIIGEKFWGKENTKLNFTLRNNDVVIILNIDEWKDEIKEANNFYELVTVNGNFNSKAVILCGNEARKKFIENIKLSIKQNIGTLSIMVRPNDTERIRLLENEVMLLKKELEVIKSYLVNMI